MQQEPNDIKLRETKQHYIRNSDFAERLSSGRTHPTVPFAPDRPQLLRQQRELGIDPTTWQRFTIPDALWRCALQFTKLLYLREKFVQADHVI